MNNARVIEELSDICCRQAEIIKAQAFALGQLGAQVKEEEAQAARDRLRALGYLNDGY